MPFRPSHRQLEYLVALDATRHFGRAAEQCHVSQPTLSVQIALLEKQLGVSLVERTPGAIAMSAVGADVVAAAREVLATLDDIVTLASAGRDNLGSLMRLGVVPTFGPYFLPFFLPELHRRYPALRVHVREDRPALLEEQVRNGTIDCALGQRPQEEDAFTFQSVCVEQIFLGVAGNHRLAHRGSVMLKELKGEPLLTLGRGHRLLENVRELAALSGALMADDYEGTSLDAIRQMVSIEMGLSLFPELYVKSEFMREGNVALLTISDWPAHREIGFFWRRTSARATHFRQLTTLAKQAMQEKQAMVLSQA
ncbi:hydrogen peroxide-inducible genes activator [Rhizobium sp. FY34]|uniref:hydrogen peroxide-inducible genes activator n=1 Tax=Rhizobium sp. FY34 TaxID=2562309 RepID=UPI0010C15637|nr:hydrogen peroxide-inducible genes activator [Rhizobium sp. FY34]